MQTFNLAEELEKERKKNKELEKQLNCKKEYTKYLPEDVEFIILTKSDYDRQQEELQDKVFELQDRIDKAVELLLDKYVRGLLNDNEVNNIVKILKGDNK